MLTDLAMDDETELDVPPDYCTECGGQVVNPAASIRISSDRWTCGPDCKELDVVIE